MTPEKIVAANRAMAELGSVVFPYRVARQVAGLKKRLAEEVQAVVDLEKALAEQYGGKRQPSGAYRFESAEKTAEYLEAHKKAMEEDDPSITFRPVDLSKYVGQISLSAASVEALEGFVIFEEGDDDGRQAN